MHLSSPNQRRGRPGAGRGRREPPASSRRLSSLAGPQAAPSGSSVWGRRWCQDRARGDADGHTCPSIISQRSAPHAVTTHSKWKHSSPSRQPGRAAAARSGGRRLLAGSEILALARSVCLCSRAEVRIGSRGTAAVWAVFRLVRIVAASRTASSMQAARRNSTRAHYLGLTVKTEYMADESSRRDVPKVLLGGLRCFDTVLSPPIEPTRVRS